MFVFLLYAHVCKKQLNYMLLDNRHGFTLKLSQSHASSPDSQGVCVCASSNGFFSCRLSHSGTRSATADPLYCFPSNLCVRVYVQDKASNLRKMRDTYQKRNNNNNNFQKSERKTTLPWQ